MIASPAPADVTSDPLPDLRRTLVALRRTLHACPETGFDLGETAATLRAWLEARGFEPSPPIGQVGMMVEVAGARPGPTVVYRADMDALPIHEQTTATYRSQTPGRMHACGHDAHMAIGGGVLLLARARADEFAGTVRVVFQPAEEVSPSGAPAVIADGALDGVDAAYAIHVDPSLPVGRFGFRVGSLTAACAPFTVTVRSERSGHSARPHEAVDTIWVSTQIATELYQLAGRVTDARKTAVLTLCRFVGGDALNVIPASVEFGGTLRCSDGETLGFLREKIRRVAGALGAVYGADVDVEFGTTLPAVVNTADEVAGARGAATDLFGAESAVDLPLPSMGGEDFSYFLEAVPGAMVRVGSASGPETRYPLHHARFDLDEAALPLAARLMAETCLRDLARRA
ncbi:M20 metallopeptidase family protein [Rubrivirga sp. IMCC45206]|uniref:M20 metallopeptidase family protein n=1 Tax=Rubrivirga sp. IMCC45206 TaxID=3391614 RepID=UPI00398FA4FE